MVITLSCGAQLFHPPKLFLPDHIGNLQSQRPFDILLSQRLIRISLLEFLDKGAVPDLMYGFVPGEAKLLEGFLCALVPILCRDDRCVGLAQIHGLTTSYLRR